MKQIARQAPDRWVIATRSWPDPIPADCRAKPPFKAKPGAHMSIAEAEDQAAAGLVQMSTGRERVEIKGKAHVVEKLYAIPRRQGAHVMRLLERAS